MSAGSGVIRASLDPVQDVARNTGATSVVIVEGVTWGSEQQLQEWQFGGHCPPDTSVGQLSSQPASPTSEERPLTSKVRKARKTTSAARRTAPVSHGAISKSRHTRISHPTGGQPARFGVNLRRRTRGRET